MSQWIEDEIMKNPMGLIEFTLNRGEKVTAETAAMVFMRGDIVTETKMRKGRFLKSLKAEVLGGESFFVNFELIKLSLCFMVKD